MYILYTYSYTCTYTHNYSNICHTKYKSKKVGEVEK